MNRIKPKTLAWWKNRLIQQRRYIETPTTQQKFKLAAAREYAIARMHIEAIEKQILRPINWEVESKRE